MSSGTRGGSIVAAREERVAARMRSRFITLSPAASLRDAAQVMRFARVRHVPVVRGRYLVGLLANRDVLERSLACGTIRTGGELARLLGRTSIETLVRPVEGVSPEAPLARVARLLIDDDRGCVPVVERGPDGPELVGLLTEADLLRAAFVSSRFASGGADDPGAPAH